MSSDTILTLFNMTDDQCSNILCILRGRLASSVRLSPAAKWVTTIH